MGEDDLGVVLDRADAAFNLVDAVSIVRAVRQKIEERSPTTRLREAMAIERRSFAARREAETAKRLTQLECEAADQSVFRKSVVEMIADRQFWTLHANLEWEAARATLDERREMLAHAAAGLSTPTLTIKEKARIERVLRELDAEDVLVLDDLHKFNDPVFAPNPNSDKTPGEQRELHNDRNRAAFSETVPTSRAVLLSTGCIGEDNARFGGPAMVVAAGGPDGARCLGFLHQGEAKWVKSDKAARTRARSSGRSPDGALA